MTKRHASPGYPDGDPDLFYDLSRDRLAAQADSLNALDNKLGLVLSTSSALLGIFVAVFALRPNAFHVWWAYLLFGASLLAWIVLVGFVLHSAWPRKWKSGPVLQDVFNLYFSEDMRKLKWRAANTYWKDYDANKDLEGRKVSALQVALILLVSQTALLVLALALVAGTRPTEQHQSTGVTHRYRCPARAAHGVQALALASPAVPRSVGRLRSWVDPLSPTPSDQDVGNLSG